MVYSTFSARLTPKRCVIFVYSRALILLVRPRRCSMVENLEASHQCEYGNKPPFDSSMRALSARGSVTSISRKHCLAFESSSISSSSRLTAFRLLSPHIMGIDTSKMPKSEYSQSLSRVVFRLFAQVNFCSVLNGDEAHPLRHTSAMLLGRLAKTGRFCRIRLRRRIHRTTSALYKRKRK